MSGGGGGNSLPTGSQLPTGGTMPEYITGSKQISASMPGQMESMAAQLSKGFGGNQSEWMKALAEVYSPMNIPTSNTWGNQGGANQLPGGITPLPGGEKPSLQSTGRPRIDPEAYREWQKGNRPITTR